METLAAQLRAVQKLSQQGYGAHGPNGNDAPPAVGGMCAGHRDAWCSARDQLVLDGNQEFLEIVQSSILIVCLDDTTPTTREEVGRALWHGDACNRWYDKTIELVIFANGKAGLMGEHSQFDGQVSVGLSDYMLHEERKTMLTSSLWSPSLCDVTLSMTIQPTNISNLLKWSANSSWNLMNILQEFHDLIQRFVLQNNCLFVL